MAITTIHNEVNFGVGDVVRVHQRIFDSAAEDSKSRIQVFEGMVLGIGGSGMGKSARVRKLSGTTGVELVFPLAAPVIEKIEIVRKGVEGARHAKLYFTRDQSRREIDRIYSRVLVKNKPAVAKRAVKKATAKKAAKTVKSAKKSK